MKCHNILFLTLFVSHWTFGSASLLEINETTWLSLPPLYAVDDWRRCQSPGDQFCMVDAVLFSDLPSSTMRLLQEYSQQTLKHYNRTQIHRGVCVTRCLDSHPGDGRSAALQKCLNETVWTEYGLQASISSVGWCTTKGESHASSGSRALAILCIVLVVLTVLATGLQMLGDKCWKAEGNKYLLAFSLIKNWKILTYNREQPRSDERMKSLACLEGIRVLAIQCVIFSHVLFMYLYSYTDNPEYVEQMFDTFTWQAVFNSPLWLQAFFSLSAFLTTYSMLLVFEKKPFTLLNGVMAVCSRWIRLTPVAAFALWFTMWWFSSLGAGPLWGWLVAREAEDCTARWWFHLLYVHNHLPLGKMCMGHTWYLAVDMQLHVMGILILLACLRWRRLLWPLLAVLFAASMLAAGLITYLNDLTPIITAQSPEALRTLFAGSKIMSELYLPSYTNLSGYVCGMATAFIHHDNLTSKRDLAQNKLFNLLFHLSLHLGGAVILCGTLFLSDLPQPLWARGVYAALDRTLVAVCFNVFLLGCVASCKSAFRDFLSWRGFHPLGRLSYCAFVIHFIVLRVSLGSDTRLPHASLSGCISLLITASVLTYIASVPLCLLVELPFTQLWKTLTEVEKLSEDRGEVGVDRMPLPQPDTVKSFDLVAHVTRRHDANRDREV